MRDPRGRPVTSTIVNSLDKYITCVLISGGCQGAFVATFEATAIGHRRKHVRALLEIPDLFDFYVL